MSFSFSTTSESGLETTIFNIYGGRFGRRVPLHVAESGDASGFQLEGEAEEEMRSRELSKSIHL
jgi:hypothetical protein